MKRHMNGLVFVAVLCFGSYGVMSAAYYEDSSDYDVVNAIKRYSDLTQADVAKWKLAWLGNLQTFVAGTAGMLGAYATGLGTYKFGDWVETGLVGTPEKPAEEGLLKKYLASNLFNVMSDKRFWAIAGVFGAGAVSYKVLEPRLASGIISRVRTFVEMCENLDVYSFNYGQSPGGLASMGSATANSQGKAYDPQWSSVNVAWAASNIAREKGVENLLVQAKAALQLLAQVQNTDEVKDLRTRIGTIQQYITNNQGTIQQMAARETAARNQQYAAQMTGEQHRAQLDLAKKQASFFQWSKVSLAATALGNFTKGTLKTLVYIYENGDKIAGGVVAALFLPYLIKATWKKELPSFSS
jgi:hypothetical protein